MFITDNGDLFAPPSAAVVKPWKPRALDREEWLRGIDYRGAFAWRMQTLDMLRNDPAMLSSAKAYYRTHKAEFIMHWMDTFDPRKKDMRWMPFIFFQRQAELVQFFEELDRDEEEGLLEKARDMGATWIACAYTVACWLFNNDDATGWGSRKQDLVDTIGDPDSIFEKLRLIIRRLPKIWLPDGFNERTHSTFEKLINPANGSTVTGESGDGIGRGGRKTRYVIDEAAHIERAEKIESSLGDNTNVRIYMSSVNGEGNVFHNKRQNGRDWFPGRVIETGYTRVFVMDWRDHPNKTQEWYDKRRALYERQGMLHIFAQEVDRDYSGSVSNRVIPMEWINACVDAHLKIPCLRIPPPNIWGAGLDIADEGIDTNAQALRQWIILREVEEWGSRDPGETARRSIAHLRKYRGIKVQYDSIGMGTNVKSEYNRLSEDKEVDLNGIKYVAWNAGAGVIDPFAPIIEDDEDSLMNKDFYANFKAQAWWSLRARCYKTWNALHNGAVYKPDELFSIDSNIPLLSKVKSELAQPISKPSAGLRTMVDKAPGVTKSPNCGDAIVMAFFPAPEDEGPMIGGYSG